MESAGDLRTARRLRRVRFIVGVGLRWRWRDMWRRFLKVLGSGVSAVVVLECWRLGMGWKSVDGWWIVRCLDGVVVGTVVGMIVVWRGGLLKGGTDMFNLVQSQGAYVKLQCSLR